MPENTPLEEYNNINTFSYGYNKQRFINPRIYWGTIYTVRTQLSKEPKYDKMGLVTVSYEIYKHTGELVLYCKHLQTVKYKKP